MGAPDTEHGLFLLKLSIHVNVSGYEWLIRIGNKPTLHSLNLSGSPTVSLAELCGVVCPPGSGDGKW